MAPRTGELGAYMRAALVAFAIAALTGALFRAQLAWGVAPWLPLPNVRHAHSHLMFFGWVTPALMALAAHALSVELAREGRPLPRVLMHAIGASLVLGVLSHPLFLRFGYAPAALGSVRIPPAVIVSGLVMLTWYAFGIGYVGATRALPRTLGRRAWDLALLLLVASTFPAWALAFVKPLGLPLEAAELLKHAFLDPFSEGWLVLGALGVAHAARDQTPRGAHVSLLLLAVATLFAPAAAASTAALPGGARAIGGIAGIVWGVALLHQLVLAAHVRTTPAWRLALGLGAVAALGRIGAGLGASSSWAEDPSLRLLYLHVLLLGFVTLTLVAALESLLARRAALGWTMVRGAVLAVLAALLPMTRLWPLSPGGWVSGVAAATALAAPLAVGLVLALTAARVTAHALERIRRLASRKRTRRRGGPARSARSPSAPATGA